MRRKCISGRRPHKFIFY